MLSVAATAHASPSPGRASKSVMHSGDSGGNNCSGEEKIFVSRPSLEARVTRVPRALPPSLAPARQGFISAGYVRVSSTVRTQGKMQLILQLMDHYP